MVDLTQESTDAEKFVRRLQRSRVRMGDQAGRSTDGHCVAVWKVLRGRVPRETLYAVVEIPGNDEVERAARGREY